MRLRFIIQRAVLGTAVLMIFSGCSATSSYRRYNQNEKEYKPQNRSAEADTTRTRSTRNSKKDVVIYSDAADTTDEFDEAPVEEKPVDKTKFVANIEKLKSFNVALTPREKVLLEVIKYLDTPYKYGGNGGKGIDCSAFTKQVYENSLSLDLPRSAREQYRVGDEISKDELKFGDLVFFNTTRRSYPGHVGIYLGENQFVHASRKLGVTVSSLDEAYYSKRYIGARRVETIGEN
ncbi:MAG: NlpC/P60 family protein [Bacteroidetes bacterium]|nr:NlpC/P60 family protein [Bacteroidota bacterium]